MKSQILIIIIILMNSTLGITQTLDDYYKIAAENNPGLNAVFNQYEAALQKIPQVSDLPDPNFSFGYFISPVETRVGPQRAKFSLSQMFPWFGTLKAQGNTAALKADAKFQSFIDARNKLYLQVATAFYPLYELKEWIGIEQDNIRILESFKTIATQNFENGKGTMVDVLRVDIMLKDAQTNLSILKDQKKPLTTTFNKLLNRSENERVQISDSLTVKIYADNFKKDSLIATNPRLKALDLKLKASEAAEIVARKQGLPKLGLGLDYVIVGDRTDLSMPDNGKDILMPKVSVSIPIFRAKYNASEKEAQLMKENYTNQKQEVKNRLIAEYEIILFQIQEQLQLISLYEQQIQTSEQSLNLLFTSYSNSGREFEEVLRMQQQILQYQKINASAITEYHIAIAELYYITAKSK